MDKRIYTILLIVSAIRGVNIAILMTFLPVYATVVGLSVPEIGFITMIAVLVATSCLPFTSYVVDVIGRRAGLLLANAFMLLAGLVPLISGTREAITLSYIMFYLSFLTWISARGAAVAEAVPIRVFGVAIASLAMAFQVPRTITPFVYGVLIEAYGYWLAFATIVALSALALSLITLFIHERRVQRIQPFRDFIKNIIPARSEIPLHIFLCTDRFGWGLWLPLINPYLKLRFGMAENEIGLLNTVMNMAVIGILIYAGKLVDKYGWVKGFILSEATGAIGLICLALACGRVELYAAMVLIGLSFGFWIPSFNVAIPSINGSRGELGMAYGRANFYRTLVSIPAPWIGGMLYNVMVSVPMFIGSSILFACIPILLFMKHSIRLQ